MLRPLKLPLGSLSSDVIILINKTQVREPVGISTPYVALAPIPCLNIKEFLINEIYFLNIQVKTRVGEENAV